MKRHFTIGLILLFLGASVVANAFAVGEGVVRSTLVPEQAANSVGLTRAWFAQAQIQIGREEVTSATLKDGTLFITSEKGILQAFDAEKGDVLWTVNVGDGYLLPPGVNSKIVAVACGTRLVVYDRFDGKKMDETELPGQPSFGPLVGERHIYVPTFSERVFAYPIQRLETKIPEIEKTTAETLAAVEGTSLEKSFTEQFMKTVSEKSAKRYAIEPLDNYKPFVCPTFGVSFAPPIMGTQTFDRERVAWTTDEGWVLIADMERARQTNPLKLAYRVQATPYFTYLTESRLGTRLLIPIDDSDFAPFYVEQDVTLQNMLLNKTERVGGLFLLGTRSGHVFAVNDLSGDERWEYLTQYPITGRISSFEKQVYVPTENGDFFALGLEDGKEIWRAKNIKRFIAASATRLYTIDSLDRLAILNVTDGTRIKTLKIGDYKFQIFNRETDRVYLVSGDGLVQCLHETQQIDPLRYTKPLSEVCEEIFGKSEEGKVAVELDADESEPVAEPASTPADDDPFGADDDSASTSADDDPFGADDDSASTPADDDPFGADDDSASTPADDDPFGADEDPF